MRTLLTFSAALTLTCPAIAGNPDAEARAALALSGLIPDSSAVAAPAGISPEERILAELTANAKRIKDNEALLKANQKRIEDNYRFLNDNADRIEQNTTILEANAKRMEKAIGQLEKVIKQIESRSKVSGITTDPDNRSGCTCGSDCNCPEGQCPDCPGPEPAVIPADRIPPNRIGPGAQWDSERREWYRVFDSTTGKVIPTSPEQRWIRRCAPGGNCTIVPVPQRR